MTQQYLNLIVLRYKRLGSNIPCKIKDHVKIRILRTESAQYRIRFARLLSLT